jgi:hypothetical protein
VACLSNEKATKRQTETSRSGASIHMLRRRRNVPALGGDLAGSHIQVSPNNEYLNFESRKVQWRTSAKGTKSDMVEERTSLQGCMYPAVTAERSPSAKDSSSSSLGMLLSCPFVLVGCSCGVCFPRWDAPYTNPAAAEAMDITNARIPVSDIYDAGAGEKSRMCSKCRTTNKVRVWSP